MGDVGITGSRISDEGPCGIGTEISEEWIPFGWWPHSRSSEESLTKLSSDSGEWVLLIALLLQRGPLLGTETGSFCLWAGMLPRQHWQSQQANSKWEGICPSLFFDFQVSFYCYWQNLKGSQLVKNKFCFQGSSSGITKQNMRWWVSSFENIV